MREKKTGTMKNFEKYKDKIMNMTEGDLTCCVSNLIHHVECFENCKECKKYAMEWLLSEYKETILTDSEREYLSAVIKPFREKVKFIEKRKLSNNEQFIYIGLYKSDWIGLPYFKENMMYKEMEVGKNYTLKELGL